MKKITRNKALILLSLGLFVTSFVQILAHLVGLTDLTKGVFIGVGVGLLITALIFGDFRAIRN